MWPNTWWVQREDDLPPITKIIEEARRQRAELWAAAYQPVLVLARSMLSKEIKDEERRKAVLEDFDKRVAEIEKQRGGDPSRITDQILELANYFGRDLRHFRAKRGPDDKTLLDTYESIQLRVSAILGPLGKRDFHEVARRLSEEYPFLTRKQADDISRDTPSWAAYTVLGAMVKLSPSSVRDRLTAARRQSN